MSRKNEEKATIFQVTQLLVKAGYTDQSGSYDYAITQAILMVNAYQLNINRMLSTYQEEISLPINKLDRLVDSKYFGETGEYTSTFRNFYRTHVRTWKELETQLDAIEKKYQLSQKYKNHSLSLLLNPSDEVFSEAVFRGDLPLGEEVGIIAIQRIKGLLNATLTSAAIRTKLNRAVKLVITGNISEGIFSFHYKALVFEVAKLILHAEKPENQKTVWLGTARAVDYVLSTTTPNEGIGLGCPEKDYTWGLNRAWLHCAAVLGFQFQLVEQHFPEVEQAICSGDTTSLLIQLARQIRGTDGRSQYTRGDSPTATPQEALFLMSLGLIGKKDENGNLLLTNRKNVIPTNHVSLFGHHRSHSNPSRLRGQAFAPLKLSIDQQTATPAENSSPEYRKSPEMNWEGGYPTPEALGLVSCTGNSSFR